MRKDKTADDVLPGRALRGLTSSNGAMVAAATMTLPERPEARRDSEHRPRLTVSRALRQRQAITVT